MLVEPELLGRVTHVAENNSLKKVRKYLMINKRHG